MPPETLRLLRRVWTPAAEAILAREARRERVNAEVRAHMEAAFAALRAVYGERQARDEFHRWCDAIVPAVPRAEARPYLKARVRTLVLERDGYACGECGAQVDLCVTQVARGPDQGFDPGNLRTRCRICLMREVRSR